MEASYLQPIFIALAVGISSGAAGAFIILRRMALVGDALSHVALPGIALALFYQIDPFWGVITFLILAAMVVWWLEGKTTLPGDALVGLLFTASLAVGILTIPDTEIIESLFGEFPKFDWLSFGAVMVVAFCLVAATFIFSRRFIFSIVSPELSAAEGISKKNHLLFLIIFSFVVALGIKLVGTLLMGALTIIPASIAKNICRSMTSFIIYSTGIGAVISVGGLVVAWIFGLLPGPSIILFGVSLFILSLLIVRK